MSDLHVVYAVTASEETAHTRIRVSAPKGWQAAIHRWYALDNARLGMYSPAVQERSGAIRRDPIRFYAVRSADDPDWPQNARYAPPRDQRTGRFI